MAKYTYESIMSELKKGVYQPIYYLMGEEGYYTDKITDYIIDYCRKHKINNISFQPWGGEPMIELEKVIHCKKKFADAGINAAFTIQTNGLLLTPENYKKLRDNDVHIGVSIDGLAEVHDAHRLDVRGTKTHSRIVSNLKAILEQYPDCNIGTLSVNSAYSMDNISEDVDFIVNQIGLSNIKFNLVHKIVLIEPGFVVFFKVCHRGIQPNRFGQIKFIADGIDGGKDFLCTSQIGTVVFHHHIFY